MDKWEYNIAILGQADTSKIPMHLSILKESGKQGWELVEIKELRETFYAYMKRRVS